MLVRESGPCLYVYQQQMGAHRQRGLVAVCHVDDYDAGLIKKHEKTRRDKEDDRTRLIDTLSANTGPVFLTYRDEPAVTALVEAKTREQPQHDFTAPDGIRHTAWRIAGGAEWVKAFGRVPRFYIADGHHRAASAARVARLRRERNPHHSGAEDYNWFLCVIFPAGELKILPYNRRGSRPEWHAPRGVPGGGAGGVRAGGMTRRRHPAARVVSSMYLGGRWYGLRCPVDPGADPVARLDVQRAAEPPACADPRHR